MLPVTFAATEVVSKKASLLKLLHTALLPLSKAARVKPSQTGELDDTYYPQKVQQTKTAS